MKKAIIVYKDIQNLIAEETIWVKPKGDYYQIRNIPFFAPNLALNDLIIVEKDGSLLYFDEIVKTSGHSTIQIIVLKECEKNRIIKQLELLNCQWEGLNKQKYLAVDISPQLDYKTIRNFLEKEASELVLDYKEACLSSFHRY